MTDSTLDVTAEGRRKIERWEEAIEQVKQAKRNLNRAEVELRNAINDLGKWLVPPDVLIGETIAVWHGSKLIQVQKTADRDFKLQVRKR